MKFETIDTFNGKTISKIEVEDYFLEVDMKVVAIYLTDGSKIRIEAKVEHTHGQVDDLKLGVYEL